MYQKLHEYLYNYIVISTKEKRTCPLYKTLNYIHIKTH